MSETEQYSVKITGMVQGIGFRPFVASLADELGISGSVRNEDGTVTACIFCSASRARLFSRRLREKAPETARIDRIDIIKTDESHDKILEGFVIEKSKKNSSDSVGKTERILITPDLPVCKECLSEMKDPADRRFRYPFISCTQCGPRYSIIEDIPYDRENTVMKDFIMCRRCAAEYTGKKDRRRHAQTIACHECGPQLICFDPSDEDHAQISRSTSDGSCTVSHDRRRREKDEALRYCIDILKHGGIAAVRDIGGFHLACSPFDERAVMTLRRIKHRYKKPFAVMFRDIETLQRYCITDDEERKAVMSPARPVVLLRKRGGDSGSVQAAVSAGSRFTGAMIPGNPLQQLLLDACGVLVMTSANDSGTPMITDNCVMEKWIRNKYDICRKNGTDLVMLYHERRIVTPLDDSVMYIMKGRPALIRRARGIVPEPVDLHIFHESNAGKETGDEDTVVHDIFAAGGDLKSVFCLLKGGSAYLSQYFGDAGDTGAAEEYVRQYHRMSRLFRVYPDIFVCDMHPGYISSRIAGRLAAERDARIIKVQHHHAHIASVMAENRLTGTVLGIAYDGTGFGDDGTVWGSEFLLCSGSSFKRIGHLKQIKLTGGDEGAKNALNMLICYFHSFRDGRGMFERWLNTGIYRKAYKDTFCGEGEPCASAGNVHPVINDTVPGGADALLRKIGNAYDTVTAAADLGINTVVSSSMGRLFDAAAAFLGICMRNTYEGECATDLEKEAASAAESSDPRTVNEIHIAEKTVGKAVISVKEETGIPDVTADMETVFEGMLKGLEDNIPSGVLAYVFIMRISEMTSDIAGIIEKSYGMKLPAALSGGTWQNRMLYSRVADTLAAMGVKVYSNINVPVNDGGIALGQAYIAAVRAEEERQDR